MATMFIDTSRIAVTEAGETPHEAITPDTDVMYIRKKMDFGAKQRVLSAAVKISGGTDPNTIDVGAYQLALAQINILDWAGPSFAGRPCTAKNISELDPDAPLLVQALAVVAERNNPTEPAPLPN
jgi:hypothetical protein